MVKWRNNSVNYGDTKWKLYREQHKWVVHSNVKSTYGDGKSNTFDTNHFSRRCNDLLFRWVSDFDIVQCFRKYMV